MKSMQLEGELIAWDQEGGYCAPDLGVMCDNSTTTFEEMFKDLLPGVRLSDGETGVMVRVTVEILSTPDA